MKKSIILDNIKLCKNSAIPTEWMAIHVDNYKVYFGESSDETAKPYLIESNDSVAFVKLYLIKRNQLSDLLSITFGMNKFDLNDLSLNEKETYVVDKTNDYGTLICLGQLEKIKIITVTSSVPKKIQTPDVVYLKTFYSSLKKTFSPYSNYLIMYYIYRLDGVKSSYSIDIMEFSQM